MKELSEAESLDWRFWEKQTSILSASPLFVIEQAAPRRLKVNGILSINMDVESLLASIPTPTTEYMQSRRPFARQYTLVFLRRDPAIHEEDEARRKSLHLEHLQNLTKLQILGKLILNGPILTKHDIVGVSVYETDIEEARLLAEADPKVKAGVLSVEAIPWMAVPSEKMSSSL